MNDRGAAENLLGRYIAACESRDIGSIVACFAPRAIVRDPTSPQVRGRRNIEVYFRALYDDLLGLRLQTSPLYWQGDAIACQWRGQALRRDGTNIAYEGIDVFHLSPAPLISRMQAFWDPKDFTLQKSDNIGPL